MAMQCGVSLSESGKMDKIDGASEADEQAIGW